MLTTQCPPPPMQTVGPVRRLSTGRLSKWSVLRSSFNEACPSASTNTDPLNWLTGWRDTFNRPTVKALHELKRQIALADKIWIRQFLEQNGVSRLLSVLQTLSDQQSQTTFLDTLLQLSCVACIKAVMNSKTGLEYIIENQEFVNKFAFALHNCDVSVKKQIFGLLSSLCLYSDDGHKRVLQILQAFKDTQKKPHRFSLIVDDLRHTENAAYRSTLLALINCVINGEKQLEERVRVRNEFLGLQLGSLLDGLRKDSDQDAELCIQVDVFDEKKSFDDEQLPGPEGVDLTSHKDIFNSILDQVSGTSYEFPFLAILQHLLQLCANAEPGQADQLWDTVEKLVFRAALLSKDEDPNQLLQSGNKRLERATCPCKCGEESGTNEARKRRMSMLPPNLHPQSLIPQPNSVSNLKSVQPLNKSLPNVYTGNGLTIVDIDVENKDTVDGRMKGPIQNGPVIQNGPMAPSVCVSPPPPPPRAPMPPPPPMIGGPPPPPPPCPGGPPPPPPIGGAPPPPPFGGPVAPTSALPQPVLSSIPKPKTKMRTLQWGKITAQKLQGKSSVWSEVCSSLEKDSSVDFDKMSELFSVQNKRPSNAGLDKTDSPDRKRKEEVILLDGKRSLNINIYLRQFRLSVDELMTLIQQGNSEQIGPERLMGLLKMLPEPDELEMLKSFEGDRTKLGSAEKFVMRLITIPEYKLRIECMLLKEEFNQKMDQIKPSIDSVILTTKDLMDSSEIREIFRMILLAGNYMNSGSYAGNACGFKLSSLLKLSEVRANIPRMNLLHYIVMEMENNRPELLTFHEKMKFLDDAAQCSTESINSDINSLKQRTENVSKQVDRLTDDFHTEMTEFINFAQSELSELVLDMEEVEEQKKQLADYLCEDYRQFSLEECFKTFQQFVQKFKKAIEENTARRQHEEKMAKKRRQREEENGRKKSDRSRLNSSTDESRIIDRILGNIRIGYMSGDTESEAGSRRTSREDSFDSSTVKDSSSFKENSFKRQTWSRSSDERPSRPQSDEFEEPRRRRPKSDEFEENDGRRRRVLSEDINLVDYLNGNGDCGVLERQGSASRRRRQRRDDVIIERERDVSEKGGHRRAHSDVGSIRVNNGINSTGSDPIEEEPGTDRKVRMRDSGIDSPRTSSRPTSLESPIPSSPPISESPEQEKLAFRNRRRQERAKRATSPVDTKSSTVDSPRPVSEPSPKTENLLNVSTPSLITSTPSPSSQPETTPSPKQEPKLSKTFETPDLDKLLEVIEEASQQRKEPERPKVLLPTKTDRPIETKAPHSYSDTAVSDKTKLLENLPSPGQDTSNVQNRFKMRWQSFLQQRSVEEEKIPGVEKDEAVQLLQLPKKVESPTSPTSPSSPLPRRRNRRWLQQLANRYNDNEEDVPPPVPPREPLRVPSIGVPSDSHSSVDLRVPEIPRAPEVISAETSPEASPRVPEVNLPPVPPHQPTISVEPAERPVTLNLTPRGQDRMEESQGLMAEVERMVSASQEFLRTPEDGDRLPSPMDTPTSPFPRDLDNLSQSTNTLNSNETQNLSETRSMTSLGSPQNDTGFSKLNRMLAKLPIKRRSLGIKRSRSNADMDSLERSRNQRNLNENQSKQEGESATSPLDFPGPPLDVAASSPVLNRLTPTSSEDKENESSKTKSKFGKLSRKISEKTKIGGSRSEILDSPKTPVKENVPPPENNSKSKVTTARITTIKTPTPKTSTMIKSSTLAKPTPRDSASISPSSSRLQRSLQAPKTVAKRVPTPKLEEPKRKNSNDSTTSSTSSTPRARSTVPSSTAVSSTRATGTVPRSSSVQGRQPTGTRPVARTDRRASTPLNDSTKTTRTGIIPRTQSSTPRGPVASPRGSITSISSRGAAVPSTTLPRGSSTTSLSSSSGSSIGTKTRTANGTVRNVSNGTVRNASNGTATRSVPNGIARPASSTASRLGATTAAKLGIGVPRPAATTRPTSFAVAAKPAAHAQTALMRSAPAAAPPVPKRSTSTLSNGTTNNRTTDNSRTSSTRNNNNVNNNSTADTTRTLRTANGSISNTESKPEQSSVFDRLAGKPSSANTPTTFDRNSKLRASFRADTATSRSRIATAPTVARLSARSRPGTSLA